MADGIFRCTVCGTRYLAPARCCGEACVAGVLSPGAVADSPHPSSGEPSVSLVLLAGARGDFEPALVTALGRTPGSAALELVLGALAGHAKIAQQRQLEAPPPPRSPRRRRSSAS